MSIQRVRDLKKLGDYQDILNYLNNICTEAVVDVFQGIQQKKGRI